MNSADIVCSEDIHKEQESIRIEQENIRIEQEKNRKMITINVIASIATIIIALSTVAYNWGVISGKSSIIDQNQRDVLDLKKRFNEVDQIVGTELKNFLDSNYGGLSARDKVVKQLLIKVEGQDKKLKALDNMLRKYMNAQRE